MIKSITILTISILFLTLPLAGIAQGPPVDHPELAKQSIRALMQVAEVEDIERRAVMDASGFGRGMESRQAWEEAGGPAWARMVAARVGISATDFADPGDAVLLSIERVDVRGSYAWVHGAVRFRVRDQETGQLSEQGSVGGYELQFTRFGNEWRLKESRLTVWESGIPVAKMRAW